MEHKLSSEQANQDDSFLSKQFGQSILGIAPITDLLFQSENAMLINLDQRVQILRLFNFLVSEALKALIAWKAKLYHQFDAQVGENLCQIRACFLMDMIEGKLFVNDEVVEDAIRKLFGVLNRVQGCLLFYQSEKINFRKGREEFFKYRKHLSIKDFLSQEQTSISMSKFLLIIIQCHFLRRFYILSSEFSINDDGIDQWSGRANFDRIMKASDLSRRASTCIIYHYRRAVSSFSTNYICSIATECCGYEFSCLMSYINRVSEDGRQVLPYYDTMKTILFHFLKSGYPILLRAKRVGNEKSDVVSLMFFPDKMKKKYRLASSEEIERHRNKTAMILDSRADYRQLYFNSQSDYIKRILELGLDDIILLNAASHPQYTGRVLLAFRDKPYDDLINGDDFTVSKKVPHLLQNYASIKQKELAEHAELAEQYGCCYENSTIASIRHIYCDHIDLYQLDNAKYDCLFFDAISSI